MRTDYDRILQAIRWIDNPPGSTPRRDGLAQHLGIDADAFRQLCLRWSGVGPERFLELLGAGQARVWLDDVSGASDSDKRMRISSLFPMPDIITQGFHESPFGDCLLATAGQGICHLVFLDEGDSGRRAALDDLRRRWPGADHREDQEATGPLIDRIFASPGARTGPPITLLPEGTSFQLKVWEALLRIPSGVVTSYDALARRIGSPGAARAVGSAIGANQIAYLIPCHRVIRGDGSISQFRWGADRKRAMLAWEAARRLSGVDLPEAPRRDLKARSKEPAVE
ncbi:bifunctional helix-turn-helix domain-containing protein/methylated-DNA--[protein]-cysteine S-methyltransferase [soil metagenome]